MLDDDFCFSPFIGVPKSKKKTHRNTIITTRKCTILREHHESKHSPNYSESAAKLRPDKLQPLKKK